MEPVDEHRGIVGSTTGECGVGDRNTCDVWAELEAIDETVVLSVRVRTMRIDVL